MQVADPLVAKVREPAVPAGERVSVSVLIAIVTSATAMLIKVKAVPRGYATLELAGIVNVLALLSPTGWNICLPESERTKV